MLPACLAVGSHIPWEAPALGPLLPRVFPPPLHSPRGTPVRGLTVMYEAPTSRQPRTPVERGGPVLPCPARVTLVSGP